MTKCPECGAKIAECVTCGSPDSDYWIEELGPFCYTCWNTLIEWARR